MSKNQYEKQENQIPDIPHDIVYNPDGTRRNNNSRLNTWFREAVGLDLND
jgi:hypothetical protein